MTSDDFEFKDYQDEYTYAKGVLGDVNSYIKEWHDGYYAAKKFYLECIHPVTHYTCRDIIAWQRGWAMGEKRYNTPITIEDFHSFASKLFNFDSRSIRSYSVHYDKDESTIIEMDQYMWGADTVKRKFRLVEIEVEENNFEGFNL